jgi:hypothetical protein
MEFSALPSMGKCAVMRRAPWNVVTPLLVRTI